MTKTALVFVLALSAAAPAHAQTEDAKTFPSKPIHIVVAASPGGVNDILARLVGQKLTETFRQPVVVENKPGAATILGTEYVARARPDGYTLLSSPITPRPIPPRPMRAAHR